MWHLSDDKKHLTSQPTLPVPASLTEKLSPEYPKHSENTLENIKCSTNARNACKTTNQLLRLLCGTPVETGTLKVSYRNETPWLHSHKVYSCKEKSHNLLNSALPRMLSAASSNVFNNRRDLLASAMERPRDRFRKAFNPELSNVTKFWFPPVSWFCLLQFNYILSAASLLLHS